MPMYPFQHADGTVEDLFFSMIDVPKIGDDAINEVGEPVTRLPSHFQVDAGVDQKVHGYPRVSKSLPRHLKGCKTNDQGQPIITSQLHEREIMAEHGYIRD